MLFYLLTFLLALACIGVVTFLLCVSKNILLIAIWFIKARKEEIQLEAVNDPFVKPNKAGFKIKEFHAENKFHSLKQLLEAIDTETNFCAAQKHVPEIERLVRVVKEKMQSCLPQHSPQFLVQDDDH